MDYDVLWHQYQLVTRDAIGMQSRAYAAEARVAKLEAECTHAKAELDNYKQWHEQEQIRAVDAEHQWGELVGERAVKAEARLAELEAR